MTCEQSVQDRIDQPLANPNHLDWITGQLSPAEVLVSLCHELKSPLTELKGYAELLLFGSEYISQDQQHEFLEAISKIAEGLVKLRGDILNYVNEKTKGDIRPLGVKKEQRVHYARIRYTQPGDEAGVFDFPLEAVLQELEQTKLERPDLPEIVEFIEWLSSQATDIVEVSHKQWEVMAGYAAELIEKGLFTVFCPKCERHLAASTISKEEWSYLHGPLAASGGRRFLCNRGHELLKVQDWIS